MASFLLSGFWILANDLRSLQPTVEITGYFSNERFAQITQSIKERGVAPVEFVERPSFYFDPVGQCMFDLGKSNLLLRLKLNVVRYVVFFRRASSLA